VSGDALAPLIGLAAVVGFALFVVGLNLVRTDATTTLAVEDLVLLREEQRREARGLGPIEALAGRLVPALRRLLGPSRLAALQRRIDEAGRPDGMTVDVFLRRGLWWAVLVSPLALLFLLQGNLLMLALAFIVPLLLPLSRLAAEQRKRQESLDRDLPDMLDVLAVTVSAGVAFRPALTRVSERFAGPLADELGLTLSQMANGASVREAFEALRARNSSEALAQFVTAFLQSEELGAPLIDALNQIALDMRRENAQRLRRKAARTAPRVSLVTSLVLVPGALILVIAGLIVGSGVDFGVVLGG
jgi:tight adherence protein C